MERSWDCGLAALPGSLQSRFETGMVIAYIGYGVGGALVISAVLGLILGGPDEEDSSEPTIQVAPAAGAGLGLTVRF